MGHRNLGQPLGQASGFGPLQSKNDAGPAAIAEIHARRKDVQAAHDEYQRAYDLSMELRTQDRLGEEDRDMPERLALELASLPHK